MKTDKKQRVNGEKARASILAAALDNFVAKGFAGATMMEIAQAAGVNSALLYHHFDNKNNLWKAVKAYLLEQLHITCLQNLPAHDLRAFVSALVDNRITLYQNATARRLLQWQQLEDNSELYGTSVTSPGDALKYISYLQQQNLLRADWSAEMILVILNGLTAGAMIANPNEFTHDNAKITEYKAHAIEALIFVLQPQSRSLSMLSTNRFK